jgi:hypothetical protein
MQDAWIYRQELNLPHASTQPDIPQPGNKLVISSFDSSIQLNMRKIGDENVVMTPSESMVSW